VVWLLSAGKSIKDELNQFLGVGQGRVGAGAGAGVEGCVAFTNKNGVGTWCFCERGEKRIMFCWFVVLVLFGFVLFCLIG
jgi:L-aminopeptidase/D-esterase-like protein